MTKVSPSNDLLSHKPNLNHTGLFDGGIKETFLLCQQFFRSGRVFLWQQILKWPLQYGYLSVLLLRVQALAFSP